MQRDMDFLANPFEYPPVIKIEVLFRTSTHVFVPVVLEFRYVSDWYSVLGKLCYGDSRVFMAQKLPAEARISMSRIGNAMVFRLEWLYC
jgi:hypothetical protein